MKQHESVVAGQGRHSRGIEDKFLIVQQTVPGFGGFYFDSEGNLETFEADPKQDDAARAAVRQWYATERHGERPVRIIIRRGQFGFSDLIKWEMALAHSATLEDHVRTLDADESKNRVSIDVADSASVDRVRNLATSIGIPLDALAISVFDFQWSSATSLQDRVRPIGGGLYMSYQFTSDSTTHCTMGFNAIVNGGPYFLMASHCNRNFRGATGEHWDQPDSPQVIGTTAIDPAWSTSGCIAGATYCRYTDAALGVYTSVDATFKWQVAETQNIGYESAGNVTIGNWKTPIDTFYSPVYGDTVEKTGAFSGTTKGPIIATCQLVGPDIDWHTSVYCADEAQMWDQGGDSGAPVFRWLVPMRLDVAEPYGIAFGFGNNPQGRVTLFSGMNEIQTDLGVTIHVNDAPVASISGPSTVRPLALCEWSGSTTGGVAPYTYNWLASGTTGTAQYFDYQNDGASFTVQLTVTDAGLATNSTSMNVQVSSSAPNCTF